MSNCYVGRHHVQCYASILVRKFSLNRIRRLHIPNGTIFMSNVSKQYTLFEVMSYHVSIQPTIISTRCLGSKTNATTTKQSNFTKCNNNNNESSTRHRGELSYMDENEASKLVQSIRNKNNTNNIDFSKYTDEIEVRMPEIYNGGTGRILQWFKKEGDVVQYGDTLCAIEIEDFSISLEIEDEELGIMGKILIEAPSQYVNSGEVLCLLLHKKDAKNQDDT